MIRGFFWTLIFLPFIEIYLLFKIHHEIGFANMILLLIASGFLGAHFIRKQGRTFLTQIQKSQTTGQPPDDIMIKGLFTFLGGVLLVVPGVFSDVIGLSLIFPPTQALWKRYWKSRIQAGIAGGAFHVYTQSRSPFENIRRQSYPRQTQRHTPFPQSPSEEVIDIEVKKSETFES